MRHIGRVTTAKAYVHENDVNPAEILSVIFPFVLELVDRKGKFQPGLAATAG